MYTKLRSLVFSEKGSYLIVGGLTTLLNLMCFRIFTKWIQWNVTISNILSIIIAILFAFFANKRYVFHSQTGKSKEFFAEFTKFICGRIVTMAVEIGGVFLACDILHFSPMIAKTLIQFVVVCLNYFITKFYVFQRQ